MTLGISGNWSYGTVAEFSCITGFVLSHNLSLQCTENGHWCDTMLIHNGLWNDTNPENRTCLSSGEWSDNEPYCQLVDCGKNVTAPVHGKVIFGNETTFNSEAFVNCSEGYLLNGSHTLICTGDGTWDPHLPTCSVISMIFSNV